jgi:DNA-binding transcriptional ArsR family regulator
VTHPEEPDDLNRLIHEPARLRVMALLSGVEQADFNFLLTALGLSKGNLSTHTERLERAGYIVIAKGFEGKVPHTTYRLTRSGHEALAAYWEALDGIRRLHARQSGK